MTEYTTKCRLRQPAEKTWNWHPLWYENQTIMDVVIAALLSKNRVISGLEFVFLYPTAQVLAGTVYLAGEYVKVSQTYLSLYVADPPKTYWLYVTSGGLQFSTTIPSGDFVLIGLIDNFGDPDIFHSDLRVMGYGDPDKPQQSGIDFIDDALVSGILTHTHNLDVHYPTAITVWDNNKRVIAPDSVDSVDRDTIAVNLSSYAPITGGWHLSIRS